MPEQNLRSSPRISSHVLIVDDVPENLHVLHDALEDYGYAVFVATSGERALQCAARDNPDIILLDALMPGLDGFEVCRRLKADRLTRSIPVVFMTGLAEAEHVLAGFRAGGSDYVTKPVRIHEVLARVDRHLQSHRHMRQARRALDACGNAVLALYPQSGRLVWETPLARKLLDTHFPSQAATLPAAVRTWLQAGMREHPAGDMAPLVVSVGTRRLTFVPIELNQDGELMVAMRAESERGGMDTLIEALQLTPREAEVLQWLTRGKTNRDIGDILGTSPRTVNKHLEHVFVKLGVETRTAAVAIAMQYLTRKGSFA